MEIAALWRYPVKSMLGEACAALELNARGAVGDRVYAVRDSAGKLGSGKNTRRFRRIDGLFDYSARWSDGAVEITGPDGRRIATDEALSAALGIAVTLAREDAVQHRDDGPLHIVTRASLAEVRADERRFRPNIVLDGCAAEEQSWIGARLLIGSAILRVTHSTERCRMVTLPQAELPAEPALLGRAPVFGVYAEVVQPGRIELGAACNLLPREA